MNLKNIKPHPLAPSIPPITDQDERNWLEYINATPITVLAERHGFNEACILKMAAKGLLVPAT